MTQAERSSLFVSLTTAPGEPRLSSVIEVEVETPIKVQARPRGDELPVSVTAHQKS